MAKLITANKNLNIRKSKLFSIFTFLCLSLFLVTCKPSKFSKFRIFRFTDQLATNNIIDSPLKTLENKLNLTQDDLSGQWTHMPSLSNKTQDVWAAASRSPLLGIETFNKPYRMRITRDGEEFGFIGEMEDKKEGWGWINTTKKLNLRKYKEFYRRKEYRGIIIRAGKSFRLIEMLPDGEVNLKFNISRLNSNNYIPKLAVSLNNEPLESFEVREPNSFVVKLNTKLEEYVIKFEHVVPAGKDLSLQDNYVLIDSMQIETQKDIILLFTPKQENSIPPPQKFVASYYSTQTESDEIHDLTSQEAYSLYFLKEKYLLNDLGIEQNPYSIKKKIPRGEHSFNALFAPTNSKFMFEVIIPEDCFLEFGCGFLKEKYSTTNRAVEFKVEIEQQGEERKVLFSKKLKSFKLIDFSENKIDMSAFENKKVKIYFSTEAVRTNKNKVLLNNNSSIWINPLLYKEADKETPNILLVSIDTLRADHLGCYGYPRETSPNMDKLAHDAVVFKNTYSTTSWTLPSHVALFTSLNTPKHKVINMLHKLDDSLPTTADILRNNSYFCAAFTGGGFLRSGYGFAKGFDSFFQIMKRNNRSARIDEAESLSRRTTAWLDKNHDKKFFLFLHTYQPHMPYENKSETGKIFLEKNSRWEKVREKDLLTKSKYQTRLSDKDRNNVIALYDGEIRYTDEYFVKPLLEKLRELSIYDNTLIIITSDHGEEFYDHKNWLHGSTLYNELIKIPLIIKFPDSLYKSTVVENTARIIDITPTVLEEAKVDQSSFDFDGKSLLPILQGNEKEDRVYYADLIFRRIKDQSPKMFATNKNGLKIIQSNKMKSSYTKNMTSDLLGKNIELYDIKKDPDEQKNIAGRDNYKKICLELIERIKKYYQKGTGPEAKSIKMDEELSEALKALGYIK